MIKVEDINVFNLAGAIEGMRFPMQSWEKSDSKIEPIDSEFRPGHFKYVIGPNDLALAQKLIGSKTNDHSKFLRQIMVSMHITAPLYWWKEMDTYKVATVANSESTMHKLASTPITKECFSFDDVHEDPQWVGMGLKSEPTVDYIQQSFIELCEWTRQKFLETKDNKYWRALIQLLPSSWNQMRHWTANYAVLRNIYTSRRSHKLTEWQTFCEEIEKLPYGKELITFGVNKNDTTT